MVSLSTSTDSGAKRWTIMAGSAAIFIERHVERENHVQNGTAGSINRSAVAMRV